MWPVLLHHPTVRRQGPEFRASGPRAHTGLTRTRLHKLASPPDKRYPCGDRRCRGPPQCLLRPPKGAPGHVSSANMGEVPPDRQTSSYDSQVMLRWADRVPGRRVRVLCLVCFSFILYLHLSVYFILYFFRFFFVHLSFTVCDTVTHILSHINTYTRTSTHFLSLFLFISKWVFFVIYYSTHKMHSIAYSGHLGQGSCDPCDLSLITIKINEINRLN